MVTFVSVAHPLRRLRLLIILLVAAMLASTFSFLLSGTGEAADRFGEVYQVRVNTDTVTHAKPDPSSPSVGPLGKGAMVVDLNEATAPDGSAWTSTNVGWLPSSAVTRTDTPWVADVVVPSVSVYAYPDAKGPIRLTDTQGDLLRVTGAAMGVNGDNGVWWSTTQGYVTLDSIRPSTSSWAAKWTLPSASEAPNGWWGKVTDDTHVRVGPTTDAPIVGDLNAGVMVKVLSQQNGENVQGSPVWYRIDGGRFAGAWVHSSLVQKVAQPQPNTTAPTGSHPNTWIVVDRTASTLTFVQNGTPTFVTYVSVGKVGRDTPTGLYPLVAKFTYDRMTSRSLGIQEAGYDLPNVPFTQYFTTGGAAIHGTYWHDQFGTPMSHGCINVTWADGAYLFNLTQPSLPAGQNEIFTSPDSATPVLIIN
jgi:lipoprotein-anchoring transpeptidase ErfK/SrfK